MDDSIDFFIVKDGIYKCTVTDISFVEFCLWMYGLNMTCLEIVCNDNFFSGINLFIHCVGTDISGSS